MSAAAPVRRNDPCPCGSGRRYKECHGKLGETGLDALVARALPLHQQGRIGEAEALYREVLARDPANAIATHYLGLAAWQRGDAREGERLMRDSIASNPRVADFHNNLGLLLRDTGRVEEASACYRKTLEVDPGWFEAYNNLGLALEDLGRFDEALDAYRAAVERAPRFAAARQNRARVLLALGRYAEGWEEYRWRLLAQGLATNAPDPQALPLPPSLAGRRFELVAEQGLGDVLFFMRFAPELVKRGATLAFRGDMRLHSILERTRLITGGMRPPEQAAPSHEPIFVGDLPWLLRASVPAQFPPLALAPAEPRAASLRARLESLGPAPRVALTWRAGIASAGPARTQLKEVPLEALGAALRGARATWISVQRLPRAGEAEALSEGLAAKAHDFSASNDDLEEMLALLSVVDEYVGVSNANTHLRAGLGGSMHVLIPFPPEWRWGTAGERCAWFPAMRLHRQPIARGWSFLQSGGRILAGSTGLP